MKRAIDEPRDKHEREADHVSEHVMRMPEVQLQRVRACSEGCPACEAAQPGQEQERWQSQRAGTSDLEPSAAPPIVHEALRSPGQPLDPATRAYFDPRFGHDFSHVRVHTDAKAVKSARALNAHAYTVGYNMLFGEDQFVPATHEGRRLIAHELAHVLQFQGGLAVHRQVRGDIRQQTITRAWAELLTPTELKEQVDVSTQALSTLPASNTEREALEENLTVLEEVAVAKGIEVPALSAYTLRKVIRPLVVNISELMKQIEAVFATKLGRYSDSLVGFPGFSDIEEWGLDHVEWILNALQQARELVARAEYGTAQSAEQFRQAGTRYMAGLLGAQSMTVWLAYLQTGAAALSIPVPIDMEFVLRQIWEVQHKLDPTLKELRSLDMQLVERGAARFVGDMGQYQSDYRWYVATIEESLATSGKVIKAMAIWELGWGLIGGLEMLPEAEGGGLPPGLMPGIGGISGGGAATIGGRLAISVEWLEAMRKLQQLGVVSIGMAGPAVSYVYPGGTLPTAELPTPMQMAPPKVTTKPAAALGKTAKSVGLKKPEIKTSVGEASAADSAAVNVVRRFADKVPFVIRGAKADLDAVKGTGVYVLKDKAGTVLYVGEGNVWERLGKHIADAKKTSWFGEIAEFEVRASGLTKSQSLALEEDLIQQLNPLHNLDRHPYQKAFGNGASYAADLAGTSQKTLRFEVELGAKK